MNEYLILLLTLLSMRDLTLVKVAFNCPSDKISEDCGKHFLEPENRDYISSLLPQYLQDVGPIVDVEEIFDFCEKK